MTNPCPTGKEIRFDCFIRGMIRNGAKYFSRAAVQISENELSMDELHDTLRFEMEHMDTYTDENFIYAGGHKYIITNPDMYDALQMLNDNERLIILKSFWDGISDTNIAHEFGTPIRTINSRKHASMNKIKNFLESRSLESGC